MTTYKSIVAQADVPNRNKRVYSKELLEKAVQDYQEKIQSKTAFGYLDNNSGLSNVSHLVTSLELKEDMLVAEIETLNTPDGKILKKLIEDNSRISFSTFGRGDGVVDDNCILAIKNYKLNYINVSFKENDI